MQAFNLSLIPYKASGHRDEPRSRAVRHWKKQRAQRHIQTKK